jgi:excisionase family DNA binding protein
MDKIIFTNLTMEQLEELITKSTRNVLNEYSSKKLSNELLNVKEASQFLDLAVQTIYGFTSANKIPYFKKGKKLIFKRSDLENWQLENSSKTLSDLEIQYKMKK